MPKHYELTEKDSFVIPYDCIARVHKRGKFMGTFSFVYHHALMQAGIKAKNATKTLIQLMSLPDFENVIYVNITSLSEKTGLTKSAVYRHLNSLREEGIIIPHEDIGINPRVILKWRLCPFLGWKGTAKSLEVYLTTLTSNHVFFNYADPEFYAALKEEINLERITVK